MARKRKTTSKCKVGGRGCGAFLKYLTGTLIPDTKDTGREGTLADLKALVQFIGGAKSVRIGGQGYKKADWIYYVENTLIPDYEENGWSGYADDFREGLEFIP